MKTFQFISILLFLPFILLSQKTSKGVVSRVLDGDSFIVEAESYRGHDATLRIRIVNVDCPEVYFIPKRRPAQPYGDTVKALVNKLLLYKEVGLTYYGRDRFNRVLAFVTVGGERLDDIILKNGWGWADNRYHSPRSVKRSEELEKQARGLKLGLWADPNPIRPSDWRKM